MRDTANLEKYVDVIVCLVDNKYITLGDLQEQTGLHERTVSKTLHLLRDRGVVKCRNGTRLYGQVGNVPHEWVWVGRK